MNNDPELDGKYLGKITKDFAVISETLKDAAYQIRSRGYSDYPIFPVTKTDLAIGELLIGRGDVALDWDFRITYLDEFVQRKIIDEEKVEAFKKNYKDPDEFCCLFVFDGDFARFMYIPYPED